MKNIARKKKEIVLVILTIFLLIVLTPYGQSKRNYIKLNINQAIDLACNKLDIIKSKIKYIKTDIKRDRYEIELNGYRKYYINSITGDFLDEDNERIINLLGIKEKRKIEISTDKKIEDIILENIGNNINPGKERVKYSAEISIPFFTPTERAIEGGLIIDNIYKKFSSLGITEFVDEGWWSYYYFVDINNDGIDEICRHAVCGTGLFPNTQIFKINKSTSKYSEWNPNIPDNSEDEMDYSDIQFFKNKEKTYMVVFDDKLFISYYIQGNKVKGISKINITYPTYETETKSKGRVLTYIKDKYSKKITFFDKNIPDEHVLKNTDKIYPLIDLTHRKKFLGRTYTIKDLDNDGDEELFFKWEGWSQTKLNSTIFSNGYAIFKKKNNKYTLYDTNEDRHASKYKIYNENEGAPYNNNIFFETYNRKVYTIIIDKAYYDHLDFDIRNKDILKVYYINENEFDKLGEVNVIWKPKINITKFR